MTPRSREKIFAATLLLASITAWDRALGPGSNYWDAQTFRGDAPKLSPAARPEGALRVLFVGNSFTRYWGGQALIQTRLAMSRPGWEEWPPILEQSTGDGFTLMDHWMLSRAPARVREGHWDFVVLQDHSEGPLKHRADFFAYAARFDAEAKKVGAKTVLFMTWAKAAEPYNASKLAEAYDALGRRLGAAVVPVGLAFAEATAQRPDLNLYAPDGKHPSPAGSYLAACCFDCFFHGRDPTGDTRLIFDRGKEWIALNELDAAYLQGVAHRTVTRKR